MNKEIKQEVVDVVCRGAAHTGMRMAQLTTPHAHPKTAYLRTGTTRA